MIRISSMVAMLLSIGAIGLGRLSPGEEGRTCASARVVGLTSSYHGSGPEGLRLLDTNEGTTRTIPLSAGERVDLAVSSPWIDGWDQAHVAGRWMQSDAWGSLVDCGLARVAYPSGRVIDRVALDRYPVTPPCWGAGTSARVLFVSSDGNLYRYDFDSPAPGREPGLARVRWEAEAPADPAGLFVDVCRPQGILAPDLLLATMMPRPSVKGQKAHDQSEIWWLRLSPDEDAVISCGPVTTPDPDDRDVSRRRPALGRRSDGAIWLAYLAWRGIPERLALRIAPVRLDEETGTPTADTAASRILAETALNSAPIFVDGGDAVLFQALDGREPVPVRLPLEPVAAPTELAAAEWPANR